VTLTKPDRSVIQQQKTHVSTSGLTFHRGLLERFYRQGFYLEASLSIQFVYKPTPERTFVELFDCSIGSDRLTGSFQSGRTFSNGNCF
jgi:hypothetical protein